MNKRNNLLKFIFKAAISVALFTYIYYRLDKEELIQNVSLIDYRFAPLILICIVLNYIVSSIRWKQLLVHKNSENASVEYLTGLYFIGSFFNNFMPTSIGGDVYKVIKLGKKIGNTGDAFAATFMERFTGMLVLALFSVVAFVGVLKYWMILLLLWFALGVYVGYLLIKYLRKKSGFVAKIYRSFEAYTGHTGILIKATLLSVLVQMLSVLSQYLIFLALGYKINFLFALFAFPVITLATFFIPSLNGIGVQDGLYTAIFGIIGISLEVSVAASVLYHLFRLGTSLIGGILYALGKSD